MGKLWDWVREYRAQALARGDRERIAMTRIHSRGYESRETDPAEALAIFDEGRRTALALKEPEWVLFFDHWRATAYMYFLRDFSHILDLTVASALEVRKPTFDRHPLRLVAYDDLVASYIGIDALGYADLIQQSLEYQEHEIDDEPDDTRYLFLARKRHFAMELDRLDEAYQLTQGEFALAERDNDPHRASHFCVFLHAGLCDIAYRQGNWELLQRHANLGEALVRVVGHQLELSEFLIWQAVLARRQGDEENAHRFFETGRSRFSRVKMPPTPAGFNAMAAYYSLGNDLKGTITTRRNQLEHIDGQGRLGYRAKVYLELCQALSQLGVPFDDDITAARQAIQALRNPEPYQQKLDAILADTH